MPTYRYRCGRCGDELEVWQSITADPLTEHEDCGGDLVKVLSPAGIVLKGSGFYKNDSRSGNGSKRSSERKDSGTKESTSKESGSTDSSSKDSGSTAKSSDSSSSGDSKKSGDTKSSSSAKP